MRCAQALEALREALTELILLRDKLALRQHAAHEEASLELQLVHLQRIIEDTQRTFTSSAVLAIQSAPSDARWQQKSARVALQPRPPAPPRILSALRDLSLVQGSTCVALR